MFMKKPKRPLARWPLFVVGAALVYALGFVNATKAADKLFSSELEKAKAEAYQRGLDSQEWKTLAKENQAYADKLCHAWWFGLSHEDRKIDLTGKPKRM